MNFFKHLRKKNIGNKGVTLVEVICAIGILSLVGTAVVGLVLVASRSYQRSVIEIEVQQEAQFAANLIGDLLKDASEVEPDSNPIVITKTSSGGTTDVYRIYHQADNTLRLSLNGGPMQLMAENVSTLPNVVPTYTGSNTYTVNMNVQRTEAAKEVQVVNSNNARNEKPDEISDVGEITASILAPGEMILEPNQNKEIPFAVTGVSNNTVYWSLSGNSDPTTRMDGNKIIVGASETAPTFYINGVTAAKKRDGLTPAGNTTIIVYVRRVTGIALNGTLISGSDGTAGAKYKLTANVYGVNMDRKPSMETDYISPYAILWDCYVNGTHMSNSNSYFTITNTNSGDGLDQNYIELRLNANIDSGTTLRIQATSAHPKGKRPGTDIKTNKSGVAYTPSYSANYTIEGHIYTLYPGNFYRGTDQAQGSLDEWTVKQLVGNAHGIDPNQLRVFKEVRYKVRGTNNWTSWIQLNEGGNAIRIHEDSWMFACDKDYDIEIRFGCINNYGQKLYPTNLSESAYTIRTGLEHAKIRFNVKTNKFNQSDIYGVGPVSNPIKMSVNTNLYFEVNQSEANRQAETALRWDRFNKSLVLKIQKLNGNKWVDVPIKYRNDGGNVEVRSNCDSGRNLAEMTRTGNYFTFYKKGTYRILVGLGNELGGDQVRLLTYNEGGRYFETSYRNYNLWNEATGEGIFYIKVE